MPKRVRPWWFTTDSGKLALSVRYGTRVLELARGKVAVEVGSEKDLVPTLELIKTAFLNGELDTQIDAAANKLRDGFAQYLSRIGDWGAQGSKLKSARNSRAKK